MSVAVWHSRLGHPSISILKFLVARNNLPIHGHMTSSLCHSCLLGKSHKLPFQLSSSISKLPLNLIHLDVWTSPSYSIDGFKYYVVFIDDYSRYSWIYPLKLKLEVFKIYRCLIQEIG